jgi:hypothetical protein
MENNTINSQNNLKCTKIRIVSIKNPFDFWISFKNDECLDKISQAIANEKNIRLDNEMARNDLRNNSLQLIGFHSSNNKWYRARVIEFKKVFSGEEELVCFLVDKGETCSAPVDDYKKITNKKLINFSPLVIQCALYGIKPLTTNSNAFRLV